MLQKREYWREYFSILQPERLPTGWKINPQKLLELLCFKYFWLGDTNHWKLYGDAREIGGQQSAIIALSILNEAALHGIKYHEPNEVYPIAIFYGKDARDNLEEDLGFQNSWLEKERNQGNGHIFYLCGDEMFLESALDGDNVLGPNTKQGWDIYHQQSVDDKNKTVNNLRSELDVTMDRHHGSNILNSVPLNRTVFCLLHAVARCVEKLLTLEVELITQEANKVAQLGMDASEYMKEKLVQASEAEYADTIYQLSDFIHMAGCRNLAFDFRKRPLLVKYLIRFFVVDRLSPALEQFEEGLTTLGVLREMKNFPDLMYKVFKPSEDNKITAQDIINMFVVERSAEGSNRHKKDAVTHVNFLDLLDNLEREGKLETFAWATGLTRLPILGFSEKPTLGFDHPEDLIGDEALRRGFPFANTCGLILRLPVLENEDEFMENMRSAVSFRLFTSS
ncbi:G2/M phase-specific E3 ubiquitin-protein ligase [Holothuria leucospilota]|uniref:G2/M phase-specific E3 ubiquitin-protein ligase n=1 Tax=Holothuria leucospilota TaxID=206669 RepID=A0A9Q1CSB0_HOLLE|nr:G2/M phase-specific E3 ubiquitin-protein ligase [Holothuria leucospilota]